jgi:hypothetical protein
MIQEIPGEYIFKTNLNPRQYQRDTNRRDRVTSGFAGVQFGDRVPPSTSAIQSVQGPPVCRGRQERGYAIALTTIERGRRGHTTLARAVEQPEPLIERLHCDPWSVASR